MAEERAGTCPACGGTLIVRIRRRDNKEFLGCDRYPDCVWTGPLTAWLELRRAGAQILPGLEDL